MKTDQEVLDFFGVELNKIYQFKLKNGKGYFKITRTDSGELAVRCSDNIKIVEKGKGFEYNLLILQRWSYKECEKPILDNKERAYLSAVIKPFKERIEYIIKFDSSYENKRERISIKIIDGHSMLFPDFNKNTMYKNMETAKIYTLEELDL